MPKFSVHALDVCGNEEGDFEVNDVYPSQGTIELAGVDARDEEIFNLLQAGGFIRDGFSVSDVSITGDDCVLYVDEQETGRPVFHLILSGV